MINIRAIIQEAFQCAGVLDDNTSLEGSEANLGVTTINEILSQLNVDQLFPFSVKTFTHNIPSISFDYLIGPTGAMVTDRPVFINKIYYQSNSSCTLVPVNQYSVAFLAGQKVPSASGIPCGFSYNARYPDGLISFDVAPQPGSVITVVYNEEIPQVTIDSKIQIPLEYNKLIKYALAREIAQRKMMPVDVVASCDTIYNECKSRIELLHSRNQAPFYENRRRVRNNILTGIN